jgi:hypothetical protein
MKDYRVVHIERLIIEGDTKTALLQLSKHLEQFESDLTNDVLLYLGQLNGYERDVAQGVQEKGGTEVARIQRATLSLKDELQSILESKGQVQTQAPANDIGVKMVDRFLYILEDDFTQNNNEWLEQLPEEVENKVSAKFYFDKKQYFIEGTVEDNSMYYSSILCVLEQDKDFKIEATLECLDIKESGFYGLIWGANSDLSGFHCMSISSEGAVCIDTSDNTKEDYTTYLPWTNFAAINQGQDTNTFTVENDNQKLKFFINGKLVHIQAFLPFFGNFMGFIIANKVKICARSLKIGIA